MKKYIRMWGLALFAVLIVMTAPAAKADFTADFDGLVFYEVPGFFTVIVDADGAEHRYDGVPDLSEFEMHPEILFISSYRVYCGETEVMRVDLRELTAAESEPGITGSVSSVLTNGYYAVGFDIDDEYEAFLTGLTAENLQSVQDELITSMLSGSGFNMTHLDFIDAEKVHYSHGTDTQLCWAAACSNILHYTGWAQKAGFATSDDVFEVFIDAFDDAGGNAVYGFPWFFGGINAKQGASNWAQVDNTEEYAYGEFNGFLPSYAINNFLTSCYVDTEPQSIEQAFASLRNGAGSTISFGWYDDSWTRTGGHAISLWGYIQRKNASGFDKEDYYALIVSDSDSDKFYDERRSAPNVLWMLPLTPATTTDGDDSWLLNGYDGTVYALLEAFYVLNPYSDVHPAETAESADKFDGVATDIIPYISALCGDKAATAFTSTDSITLRYGAKNASQFSWSESRTVKITYSLTNGSGETLDTATANGALTLSSGGAQFYRKTVQLPAGEYTVTVTVSMADSSYAETYYSNNTASYSFTVVDVPELTLSAASGDAPLTVDIAVDDVSALAYYDLFELSVSCLKDGVWSDWATVFVGDTVPTSCTAAAGSTQIKLRLEAECRGLISHSWESEAILLSSTVTLTDGGDLLALLASDAVQDGTTIQLLGTGFVNDLNSDSAPWVIDKAVTIRGGTIDLRAGGILLGADVTFDGVTLAFGNRVRNAVMANGYTLTLNDVLQSGSANAVHLFCGRLTGHTVTAAAGTHGRIIITGSTSLGNIYAGSMSSDGAGNSFTLPASVIVDSSATGSMGTVYACGALETPVDPNEMLNPDYVVAAPAANAELFPVTGAVSIALYQSVIRSVSGLTGGSTNATVTFNGTGDYCALTLTDLGGLSVQSGHLAPENSNFGTGADVSIAPDARLDLTGFGNSPAIADFTGGGELVLGESQTLTVTGSVSGVTTVGIGGIFNGASEGTIDHEHIYIIAANSTDESFVLLPPDSDTAAIFLRGGDGSWTIPAAETAIIIESASVPETIAAESGLQSAEIPVTVSYVSDLTYSFLGAIPVEVTVNAVAAELCEDEYGYYYTFPESDVLGEAAFYIVDETTENLTISAAGDGGVIPDGEYTITITIPATYTESGEALVLTTVLTVGEVETAVASGECGDNLTWTLTDDGTLTISGEGEMWGFDVVSPQWDDYNSNILSIVIEDGVTSIGDCAFYNCDALTSIVIPDSVTSINNYAFYNCTALETVYYGGTQEDWENIVIDTDNELLLNAELVFSSELRQDYDGVWRYYVDGTVATDYTGLVEHTDGKTYYVYKGVVPMTYVGLYNHTDGKIYYIYYGVAQKDYVGLYAHTNGVVYYIDNGTISTTYTGLYAHSDGKTYYVYNGVIPTNYIGLCYHTDGKTYYIYKGVAVSSYTGLYNHTDGKVYYVNRGVIDPNISGLFTHTTGTTYYVYNGVVLTSYVGLYLHTDGNVYYVYNGVLVPNYEGFYFHSDGKLYYMYEGKIAVDYTGLALHSDGKLYYVVKGVFDPTYNGTATDKNGNEYEVVNGIAQP